MVEIQLTDSERDTLLKPVNGEGGFQSFLRKLQGQLQGNTLSLTADDVRRTIRYATRYGQGGLQDRLSAIAGGLTTEE